MFGIDLSIIALGAAVLILGGVVKGVVGIGLPVVTIAVMSNFLPVHVVLGLVTFPIVLTNFWQAIHTGNILEPIRRYWLVIAVLLVTLWFSAKLVVLVEPAVMYGLLGGTVLIFILSNFIRELPTIPRSAEWWAGPLAGLIGGFLGGISTIWGPPITLYFLMLRMKKEEFVRTVGLIWFCASIPLVLAYMKYGILNAQTIPLSLAACVPGVIGLVIGQKIRRRINQDTFRKVLLAFLFLVGLNLIRRALV